MVYIYTDFIYLKKGSLYVADVYFQKFYQKSILSQRLLSFWSFEETINGSKA